MYSHARYEHTCIVSRQRNSSSPCFWRLSLSLPARLWLKNELSWFQKVRHVSEAYFFLPVLIFNQKYSVWDLWNYIVKSIEMFIFFRGDKWFRNIRNFVYNILKIVVDLIKSYVYLVFQQHKFAWYRVSVWIKRLFYKTLI